MNKPRVLLFDIETAPINAYVWRTYQTDVIVIIEDWFMLSFAYKWLDEKKIHYYGLPSFKGYRKNLHDDRKLSQKLWELFNEADVIVAHNGDKFDIPKSNERFIYHGFNPPSPYETIDTLKISRVRSGFSSNRLNDISSTLSIGKKMAHEGKDTWLGCMRGDIRSWKIMERYNKHDVFLLEQVYLRLRAWDLSKKALNPLEGCPKCQSILCQKRGLNRNGTKQRFQCKNCGHWYLGKKTKGIL